MSCSNYKIQISEALDSLLSEQEAVSLQEHLRLCGTCRRFDREQRELTLLLQKADPDQEPPAHIWHQIERRIQAQGQAAQPRRWAPGRLRDLFRLPQWGYAMAAIVLAAAMGLTVFKWDNSGDLEAVLAELDAYHPELRSNNPFLPIDHDRSRNPFGDFRSEK